MDLKRYAIFAGLSLTIHSVAFSASYKPLSVSPITSPMETPLGQAVSIQFVAAPSPMVKSATTSTSENKLEPKPKPEKPKVTTTVKKTDLPTQKEPKQAIEKPITVEKPISVKKTVSVKNAAVEKVKTATEPVPVITSPTQRVTKTEQQEQAEPVSVAEENQAVNELPQSTIDPVTTANNTAPAAPKLVKKPTFETRPSAIDYPRSAKRRNIQGVVLVEVWLDPEGDQTKLTIVSSSGHQILDSAALKGISEWQFRHHKNDGQAIAHRVQIPINFKLH
ncbi:energy transducer TonB [Vibrio sp. YMD68]|uniref:energy transducer TonB n=1 Tax=Vibrio sp. YMD68 TaxID=3042300 RepID=UPI00249AFEF3|nr:energy transducer TonB [Vibrio sp. YMD68]WGV98630.1 energy transducer TonB [Vibrio sp. YMD68]